MWAYDRVCRTRTNPEMDHLMIITLNTQTVVIDSISNVVRWHEWVVHHSSSTLGLQHITSHHPQPGHSCFVREPLPSRSICRKNLDGATSNPGGSVSRSVKRRVLTSHGRSSWKTADGSAERGVSNVCGSVFWGVHLQELEKGVKPCGRCAPRMIEVFVMLSPIFFEGHDSLWCLKHQGNHLPDVEIWRHEDFSNTKIWGQNPDVHHHLGNTWGFWDTKHSPSTASDPPALLPSLAPFGWPTPSLHSSNPRHIRRKSAERKLFGWPVWGSDSSNPQVKSTQYSCGEKAHLNILDLLYWLN